MAPIGETVYYISRSALLNQPPLEDHSTVILLTGVMTCFNPWSSTKKGTYDHQAYHQAYYISRSALLNQPPLEDHSTVILLTGVMTCFNPWSSTKKGTYDHQAYLYHCGKPNHQPSPKSPFSGSSTIVSFNSMERTIPSTTENA